MLGLVFGIPTSDEVLLTIGEETLKIWGDDTYNYKKHMNKNWLEEERRTSLKSNDLLRADFR